MIKINRQQNIAAMSLCIMQIYLQQKNRRKRKKWKKRCLQNKTKYGHIPLVRELKVSEQDDLKNCLRMSGALFDELLSLLSSELRKKDTVMRKSISPEERLIATLRYLATGQSYESLKFSTAIAAQTLGYIIPETCKAICKVLQKYMKIPQTKEEWQQISSGFKTQWQIINCGGAIDGKHIRITPPPGSASLYYNYKKFYSIILMAVINHNYEFIYVDIGKQGRMSGDAAFALTSFGQSLHNNILNLPETNETDEGLNFVFLADDAFPLHTNILKPFPQTNLTEEKHIYNYRISHARNVVENTFGNIASVFRILHTPINIGPEKIKYIIMAICYLHNFLRKNSPSYSNFATSDTDLSRYAEIIVPLQAGTIQNSSVAAKINRQEYIDYFNGKGKVVWQDEMLLSGRC